MKREKPRAPIEVRRASKNQQGFERNEWLENLLVIQRDEPKRFALFSPSLKVSVGVYARQKARAEEDAFNLKKATS
jgi:hypothetical protein